MLYLWKFLSFVMQDTECKLSLIIGDVIDNFTNIEITIKNIIWYGFSMIPYKNDVVHLKFVAMTRIYPSYIEEYILFLVTSALPQPCNIYIMLL